MIPEIYCSGRYCLDFAQIKTIKKDAEANTIIFEFKTRAEFLENPETGELQLYHINESPVTTVPFHDFDCLNAYYEQVVKDWDIFMTAKG